MCGLLGFVGWVWRRGSGEEGGRGFFRREVWCFKNRAVLLCGRDDVVWMLCFTFFGRVVSGVVGWGGGGGL